MGVNFLRQKLPTPPPKKKNNPLKAGDTPGDFIRRSRQSAKIARCVRCSDGDFRRSPRSAYKIADIRHVRYGQLNFPTFQVCLFPRFFTLMVNQSGWAFYHMMTWLLSGNEIEVPNCHEQRIKSSSIRINK